MIVKKTLSPKSIYEFAGHHLGWLTLWMFSVTALYHFTQWRFIVIPWLPISLIGTAVALYVGFKNNQSYHRLWEGRKIWGAITNNSRKLATMIKNYSSDEEGGYTGAEIRKEIVRRHIAYLYQLREQLLEPTQWEHVSLSGQTGRRNRKRHEKILANFKDDLEAVKDKRYISEEEEKNLQGYNNKASQLLDKQTHWVQYLFGKKAINLTQQVTIQDTLNAFYDEQGKAERIKRFPLPRKYASFSFILVAVFVFLLPFGIVNEFGKLHGALVWLSVPVGVVVGWVYIIMELIGDYSENPFEGLHNDVPMLTICRTIEIDLLQMIDEKDVPKPIQSKDNIMF